LRNSPCLRAFNQTTPILDAAAAYEADKQAVLSGADHVHEKSPIRIHSKGPASTSTKSLALLKSLCNFDGSSGARVHRHELADRLLRQAHRDRWVGSHDHEGHLRRQRQAVATTAPKGLEQLLVEAGKISNRSLEEDVHAWASMEPAESCRYLGMLASRTGSNPIVAAVKEKRPVVNSMKLRGMDSTLPHFKD